MDFVSPAALPVCGIDASEENTFFLSSTWNLGLSDLMEGRVKGTDKEGAGHPEGL